MANDLMFLSRQVLEHSHALLIARLKFQEARVAKLEAALRLIAENADRHDEFALGQIAERALKGEGAK